MPSSYASLFDDLLANNEKQMKEVMGGTSNAISTPPTSQPRIEQPAHRKTNETLPGQGETSTISGTANGVPFKLTV